MTVRNSLPGPLARHMGAVRPDPDAVLVRPPMPGENRPEEYVPRQCRKCFGPLAEDERETAICARCTPPDIAGMARRIDTLETTVAELYARLDRLENR